MEQLSFKIYKLAKLILAYCKPCPDYKGGKGECVYPHGDQPVGPGTGWPKKPHSISCEDLARNLSSHGGYMAKKKKKK